MLQFPNWTQRWKERHQGHWEVPQTGSFDKHYTWRDSPLHSPEVNLLISKIIPSIHYYENPKPNNLSLALKVK